MNAISVPDPDLEISGVGRSSRPLDKGGGGRGIVPPIFFSALRASVWSKNKGGREGAGPLVGSAAAFPFSFPPEIG